MAIPNLVFGLHYRGQYPEEIGLEFDQLTAAIQTWADQVAASQTTVDGTPVTATDDPRMAALIPVQSIPNGGFQEIQFTVPSTDPTQFYYYLQGSFIVSSPVVYITEPGLYEISGHVLWATPGGGTYRLVTINNGPLSAILYNYELITIGYPAQHLFFGTFNITSTYLSVLGGRAYVSLGVSQDSGAALNIVGGVFRVHKIG